MSRRRKVDIVAVTCYGRTEVMERGLAVQKYQEAILGSEGSERDRYVNIYFQLTNGAKEAFDC